MGESTLIEPSSAAYLTDPYAHLARLRAEGNCVVDPGTGMWFMLGYEHVQAALAQIVRGHQDGPDRHVHFPANPFYADGPGHSGPRRLIASAFTNREVDKLRGRAQSIVDGALAGKGDGDELRVVDEIGFVLPYLLTCELLGVPDVDNRDELREWTWKCLELIDLFATPDQVEDNIAASGQLAAHLEEVLPWKRDHLGDDLFSLVIRAADAGEVMRPEQVIPYVHTLYLAGMHTTVNQIALCLHALLTNRAQWELLCAEPERLDNAVEELLRFEPTAQYMRRTAEADVTVAGIDIPAGTTVVCWIASANRDPAKWGETADRLDITRGDARQHIAFGYGPHTCIGSWLARLELKTVLSTILQRFPKSTLPDQDLIWRSNVIRGPQELTLELRT